VSDDPDSGAVHEVVPGGELSDHPGVVVGHDVRPAAVARVVERLGPIRRAAGVHDHGHVAQLRQRPRGGGVREGRPVDERVRDPHRLRAAVDQLDDRVPPHRVEVVRLEQDAPQLGPAVGGGHGELLGRGVAGRLELGDVRAGQLGEAPPVGPPELGHRRARTGGVRVEEGLARRGEHDGVHAGLRGELPHLASGQRDAVEVQVVRVGQVPAAGEVHPAVADRDEVFDGPVPVGELAGERAVQVVQVKVPPPGLLGQPDELPAVGGRPQAEPRRALLGVDVVLHPDK
jgi:hypothetical protein